MAITVHPPRTATTRNASRPANRVPRCCSVRREPERQSPICKRSDTDGPVCLTPPVDLPALATIARNWSLALVVRRRRRSPPRRTSAACTTPQATDGRLIGDCPSRSSRSRAPLAIIPAQGCVAAGRGCPRWTPLDSAGPLITPPGNSTERPARYDGGRTLAHARPAPSALARPAIHQPSIFTLPSSVVYGQSAIGNRQSPIPSSSVPSCPNT